MSVKKQLLAAGCWLLAFGSWLLALSVKPFSVLVSCEGLFFETSFGWLMHPRHALGPD